MNNTQLSQAATPGSILSLVAMAKAITRFLFGEAQLPASLSHYSAFFTGLAAGAVTAPVLYAFFSRNQRDRAKIRFAVFHIMRIFQHRPDYATLLNHPRELLMRMESEVMHLIDDHLTMNDAGEVMKKLKRNYAGIVAAERTNKRIRGNKRNSVEECRAPYLASAYAASPRGFLPLSDTEYTDCNFLTSNQKQVLFEPELDSDALDIDHGEVPLPQFLTPVPSIHRSDASPPESAKIVGCATASTTALLEEKNDGYESGADLSLTCKVAGVPLPTAEVDRKAAESKAKARVEPVASKHAPQYGSFGLDYNDKEIYSSSDSSSSAEDLQPAQQSAHNKDKISPPWLQQAILKPHHDLLKRHLVNTPPTVVRKLHGERCSGTSLSTIKGSPPTTECLPDAGDAIEDAEKAPIESTVPLPFAHWSTDGQLEFSSSEDDGKKEDFVAPEAAKSAPASPPTANEQGLVAGPAQGFVIDQQKEAEDLPDEDFPPARSRSTTRSPDRRSAPLADITTATQCGPSNPPPASPTSIPMKRGRGRGRTGAAQDASATPMATNARNGKKEAITPGTRKTARQTAYQGSYGK